MISFWTSVILYYWSGRNLQLINSMFTNARSDFLEICHYKIQKLLIRFIIINVWANLRTFYFVIFVNLNVGYSYIYQLCISLSTSINEWVHLRHQRILVYFRVRYSKHFLCLFQRANFITPFSTGLICARKLKIKRKIPKV